MKKTLFTMLLIVAIALSVTVISCSSEVKAKSSENYITFSSEDKDFVLTIPCVFDGKLYYSTDASTWTEVTATDTKEWGSAPTSCTDLTAENGKLYLRGNNTTITRYGVCYARKWIIKAESEVSLSGNIMTLLNYDSPATEMKDDNNYCFKAMFQNCTSLTDVSNLILQATKLATSCYQEMFYGCTSLTDVPALPATTLAPGCYAYMFQYCTSLTKAPALPATTLTNNCYGSMFWGCTSLEEAPELKSTALETSCYNHMFYGCTGLTIAPALPATTLTNYCYNGMFQDCTGLTDSTALPATTLTDSCYKGMFNGCTSLTSVPVLSATDLAKNCYAEMFKGCTSLTEAPTLPAITLAEYCYQSMFENCSKLKVGETTASTYVGTKIFTCPNEVPLRAVMSMFTGTGGTFTDTPESGNTYYWYIPDPV